MHNIEIIIYIIIFIYISIVIDISRSGRVGLFKVRLGSHRSKTRIGMIRFKTRPSTPLPFLFLLGRTNRMATSAEMLGGGVI